MASRKPKQRSWIVEDRTDVDDTLKVRHVETRRVELSPSPLPSKPRKTPAKSPAAAAARPPPERTASNVSLADVRRASIGKPLPRPPTQQRQDTAAAASSTGPAKCRSASDVPTARVEMPSRWQHGSMSQPVRRQSSSGRSSPAQPVAVVGRAGRNNVNVKLSPGSPSQQQRSWIVEDRSNDRREFKHVQLGVGAETVQREGAGEVTNRYFTKSAIYGKVERS